MYHTLLYLFTYIYGAIYVVLIYMYVMYVRVCVRVRFVHVATGRSSTWNVTVMPRVQPAVEPRQRH